RRLVGSGDALDPLVQLFQLCFEPSIDLLDRGSVATGLHRLELFGRVLDLHRTLDELEAGLNYLEPAGDELFGLDQDVLSHADLSKVVQETCVAQLLELVLGESDIGELDGCDLGDLAGQPRGQAFHATRVTRGTRVSLLDGGHARLDETVEQSMYRVELALVDQRKRCLAGDR